MPKRNILKNRVSVFFILLILYYVVNIITSPANSGMSGQMLAERNVFNSIMAGLIILYCGFFVLRNKHRIKAAGENAMKLFLIYISIRYAFTFAEHRDYAIQMASSYFYLIYWGIGFLFIVQNKNRIPPKYFCKWVFALLVVYSLFLSIKIVVQKSLLAETGIIAGINVAATAYMCIPLCLLVLKGRKKLLFVFIFALISILSAKRQALLGLAIISVLPSYHLVRDYFRSFKIAGLILIIAATIWGSPLFNRLFEDIEARQERIEATGSAMDSGRSELRTAALKGYLTAGAVRQIFGGGTGISAIYIEKSRHIYNFPHCGFVEVICDYGLVGLMLFISFFSSLAKGIYRSPFAPKYKVVFWSIPIALGYSNLVTHLGTMAYLFLFIAWATAFNHQIRNEKINSSRNSIRAFGYSQTI